MAGTVTAMDIKLLVATLPESENLSRWCRRLGISRQTAYKWRARYRAEGVAGLRDRSRAPRRPAGRIAGDLEDAIVRARKQLLDDGLDHGPASIAWRLTAQRSGPVPSDATIWRTLVRRGQIVAQPRKRPKVSYRRFERERPNECWQIDATHAELADASIVEIINIIDDCSRLCPESLAVLTCTSESAWQCIVRASGRYGLPAEVLSDNGTSFHNNRSDELVLFERNLTQLGIRTLHSRPYHPQTCGKVERFHQTQRRWLDARPRPATIERLQALVDEFRHVYNEQRQHRALKRRPPAERWAALPKAHPAMPAPLAMSSDIRDHRVSLTGVFDLRQGCTIGIGRRWAGHDVTVIRRGDHVTVLAADTGQFIRELTINPTRRYQPHRDARHEPTKRQP